MKINPNPAGLFAGVDSTLFDTQTLSISRQEVKTICDFFSVGKLRHFEKEKNVTVSHSNSFVFAETDSGQYGLKIYPYTAAKSIPIEYLINRYLLHHHFPTPAMNAGPQHRTFITIGDRLATCFSYIDGSPAWQNIRQQKTIRQINFALLSLKNILSVNVKGIPFQKQESLTATAKTLMKASRTLASYDQKETIDACLQDAYRKYQHHRLLFTRQRLHSNASLTNFLIFKETVYTLDLSHIREDYSLSDLASLLVSCLFLDIPSITTKAIIKNYFAQHQLEKKYVPALDTLLKIKLINEYLKNIRREKSVKISPSSPKLVQAYLAHLSARKKCIIKALKEMNNE